MGVEANEVIGELTNIESRIDQLREKLLCQDLSDRPHQPLPPPSPRQASSVRSGPSLSPP